MSFEKQLIDLNREPDIVDQPDADTTYIGWSAPGNPALSDAKFRIKKVAVSGNVTTTTWADGNKEYDNIWNNRASLTYTFLQ